MKSKVAVVRVRPESILDDIGKLCGLAGMRDTLDASATTILKDNISWHFPFPAANTTPWQLEGTILALRAAGYEDLTCVQNRTVVTDAFKGEDLNRYIPVLKHYRVPILYNFKSGDMKWVEYKPKARMRVLDKIYPDGIRLPDYFFGKNIVHLPTVKCVSGETRIVLSDGSRLTMRELVDRQFERAPYAVVDRDGDTRVSGRVELMAMDDTGHIVPCPAKWFWRTGASGRPVLQLRTRTGRTLTASSDHRVRTPEGWTPLGNLAPGDRVAIARRVASDGASQPLPQTEAAVEIPAIAAQAGRTYSQTLSQEVLDAYRGGATVTAVARATELPWHKVNYILKRHGVPLRRNRNRLRIPARTSVDFWRWIGYVIAEGCIERGKTSDKLWWVNGEASIRDDFITLTRRLFGLEARRSTDERKRYVYGRSLGRFFEEIGLPVPLHSGNKIVPEMLFRCPDDEIAAFLSGYLDGDGSVSKKQAEISATTKSRELALDLQALLARLGVIAFVRPVRPTIPGRWLEPRTYYMITASGHDFAVLAKHLSFRHPQKRDLFEHQLQRFQASKQPSNWDRIPLPRDTFRAVRQGLGLTQAATGKPSSVNRVENGHGEATPRVARYLVDIFQDRDTENRFESEIAELRFLVAEDLAWDEVCAVEETSASVELFDITVERAGSFVGDGIVVHNCHIYSTTTGAMKNAFGGLLHDHRHYTHSWIHDTLVDLLAIQKEIHSGIFAVKDGTTAGNGPGPRTMFPVVKNLMLAAADQVAIDAVAAKMMGFDPMTIGYIRGGHEEGLGVGDPRDIEIVGEDVSGESWGFHVGNNGASLVGNLLWFSPFKVFQKLFFRTPLVHAFVFGSEVYHDYFRWPVRDSKVYEKWLRETDWGGLFQRYAQGPIGPTASPPTEPTAAAP